jgi:hypothetical protein
VFGVSKHLMNLSLVFKKWEEANASFWYWWPEPRFCTVFSYLIIPLSFTSLKLLHFIPPPFKTSPVIIYRRIMIEMLVLSGIELHEDLQQFESSD